ncbi:type I restriction enzyme S subunit [Microbacteriaceae bacterium MWH-Ta3]|nr:type I restriction enzyme S subunit [Microbacteriaceae bacterium MWH-Ta3]
MREIPLGDLLETVIDHRGKTPKKLGGDFTASGVPVVSAIHIKNGVIEWSERERYVSPQMFAKWMPVRLKKGDVLLTSEAPLGETALVPSNDDLVLSQRLFALRGKPDLLDNGYLRYFLASSVGQERLNERSTGTTVVGIRQAELLKVLVPVPSLDEQRRIAGVLGALDDLIDVNRALAGDCERLARLLASTASATTTLSSFTTWGGLSTVKPAGTVDHYSLPAFDDEQTPERLDGSLIKSNKQQISQPCVLVARLNPHIPRVWMVYPNTAVSSLASTEFVPICAAGVPNEVVYAVCSAPTYLEQMNGLVTGTTGSHQRVDKDALTSVEVPDVRTLPAANLEAIALLVKQAHALRVEIRELSSTRDELLPLLMSGRMRVTEEVAA